MKIIYIFFAAFVLLFLAGCGSSEAKQVAGGKHLSDSLGCYRCHSASFDGINEHHPESSEGYMGGGNALMDANGHELISPNITFDTTGIGKWTEANFKQALQEGVTYDGYQLNAMMPRYTALSDEQLACIYAYLKSIPKIKNKTF